MSKNEPAEIPASPASRFWRVSSVISRVGLNTAAERALGFFLPPETRDRRQAEAWIRNGQLLADALGKLKGGPMKIAQMISLQDDLLPPELAPFLRTLQKDAPPVPFAKLKRVIRDDFRPHENIFRSIDAAVLASASIGQVHRGVLVDGREVAIKVQYPGIRRMIRADLRNLRGLFEVLGSLYFKLDIEPMWAEFEELLLAELDYERELANLRRFREIYRDREFRIPVPVPEACSSRVLTTLLLRGMSLDEILSTRVDQEERDEWGELIFDELVRQIFIHRFVHSDPNAANYAFLPEGRVVLYDFGNVKAVPETVATGYRGILAAVFNDEQETIGERLREMGVAHADGRAIAAHLIQPYLDAIEPLLRGSHALGEEDNLFRTLVRIGRSVVPETRDLRFPPDLIFIHRAIAGMIGNLCRMRARSAWGERLERILAEAESVPDKQQK